jgi:hypothetical protein
MGSRYDYFVHLHFFTIAVEYNKSHIEFLLNDVCLTNVSLISDWSLLQLSSLYYLNSKSKSKSKSKLCYDRRSAGQSVLE